ncbi:hypothetical protein [Zoogloea sp.]|jgi:hypothetical protein|uniref:hypothetical protein n=1 Tax=Zoogloea sp. TaxID=49181 RepID=UPI001B5DDB0A|nr:hypothetical protein [Zoogloea sp.]MBK6654929.1 hypothetical protein [Zoogloea sp.]MBK7846419.1 hypothetical protein [Zoogloea sp.]MBP7445357.1 hypothetical protein [Zoogloea sp.]HOY02511.1 hypothetical protein [Zoogloea sp.]HPI61583.1 hypothetical protein [Zoogloea sp.]
MGVIFAKTRKGHEEIETRSGGLSPRVRRVLIFVDGKRSVEDLRGMLQYDDLQHTLGMLEEDGFIEMIGPAGSATASIPVAPVSQPSLTAFRLHPPGDDPVRLQQARNFMLNTLNAFVGALGTSSLQDRVEAARSPAELRALFDEWYHAIVSSRDGRREAEQLRGKLLEVI